MFPFENHIVFEDGERYTSSSLNKNKNAIYTLNYNYERDILLARSYFK